MSRSRLLAALPYLLLLAAVAWLYTVAGSIEYAARPGQIGPGFWPRMALGLMAAAGLFELVRVLVGSEADAGSGVIADGAESADDEADDAPRSPLLLLGGIGLTAAYGLVITTLGFPVSTVIYLAAFMYLGRYRRHLVIWAAALVGTFLITNVFLNVVYVSLPRGVPPFDRVTDVIVGLF